VGEEMTQALYAHMNNKIKKKKKKKQTCRITASMLWTVIHGQTCNVRNLLFTGLRPVWNFQDKYIILRETQNKRVKSMYSCVI
jgi:hypothetical protein